MKPAFVTGLGAWAPGIADPQELAAGRNDPAAVEPPCTLLPSRLARRTSVLTRMMVEAISQAGRSAGVPPAGVPTVFATAHGESETLGALLEMLHTDGELSPTRFHNSVYNTASGYFSIAAANKAYTTTLTAGVETVALALLEGFSLLHERGGQVLVVCGDEAPTIALQEPPFQSLAVAVCLSAEQPTGAGFGRLLPPRRVAPTAPPSIPEPFRLNPVGPAWALVRALQQGETGSLALSHGAGGSWLVEIAPRGAGH